MISGPTVVKEGDKLELLGSVSRTVQALKGKYIWMKDNQPIERNRQNIYIEMNYDEPKIILADMRHGDSGTYKLQVGKKNSNPIIVELTGNIVIHSMV